VLQIKIHGLGGQGVVTAARIFAEAVAIGEVRYAQTVPAYGHERRGAPVYADIAIDDSPLKIKSFVYAPDYVVIFDMSVRNDGVNLAEGAGPHTVFIVNAKRDLDLGLGGYSVFSIDASEIARSVLGRDIPNSAMLGAMAAAGLARLDSVKNALRKVLGPALGDRNAEAAQLAYDHTQRCQ
jgi:pyruvate ferredoxin oxidoreductase gamma subunit